MPVLARDLEGNNLAVAKATPKIPILASWYRKKKGKPGLGYRITKRMP